MTKTHWKKLYNPDYLGAYSLANETGGYIDRIMVVESVKSDRVTGPNNKSEDCVICRFKGESKPMILNATNCKQMVKLSGSEFVENWVGMAVTLYVSKVKAFGDIVDALRIKAAPKQQAPKPAAKEILSPTHPKWSGAVSALFLGSVTIETIKLGYELSPENEALLIDASKQQGEQQEEAQTQ